MTKKKKKNKKKNKKKKKKKEEEKKEEKEEEKEEELVCRMANLHCTLGRLDAGILQWSVVLFESREILVKKC